MLEFFKYITSDLWIFIGSIIAINVVLFYLINGVIKVFSRFLRMIMVAIKGWPPVHLDADGDPIKVKKHSWKSTNTTSSPD